jgi:hypothetical protein
LKGLVRAFERLRSARLSLRLSEMVAFSGGKGGLWYCCYGVAGMKEPEATASTVWVRCLDNEEKVFGRRRAVDCFYPLKTVGAERVEADTVFFLSEVF